MKTVRFKTNIQCAGCVNAVTPFLAKVEGLENWSVDLQDPVRIMTVSIDKPSTAEAIQEALMKAGYTGERIN